MTTDALATAQAAAQAAAQASFEASATTRKIAELALSQHESLLTKLDTLQKGQTEQTLTLQRVEILAVTTAAQAKLTNGRVTALERWQSEVKGIVQGTGGAGRLLFYILTAGGISASLIVAAFTIAGHI